MRMRNLTVISAGPAIAGLLLAVPAIAQSVPSAEQILKETQRQQERLEAQSAKPRPSGDVLSVPTRPEDPGAQTGGPKFKLVRVAFDRSEFLTPDELAAIVAPFVGKEVEIADLFRILAGVNKLYGERGIVTALATLPPQKVENGLVAVKLTEGRLGKLEVAGVRTLDEKFVFERMPMVQGTVIDPRELSRQISTFNRTHDAQLKALLQPGSAFGLSDVQLAVIEPATNTLNLFADNQGVDATGKYQLGGFFRRYGLLGMDDRLTVYATNARKTLTGNAGYNFPINSAGTRLGLSYTRGVMAIIDGPSKPLDVDGWSQSGAISLTHPLHVTDAWLVQASASGSIGTSETSFSGVTVTETRTQKVTAGVSVAYSAADLAVTVAPAVSAVSSHSEITGKDQTPFLFTGTASATLALAHELHVKANGSWQLASEDRLPGDQLFQIGGPTTVRGYPTNGVSGDEGYLLSVELHRSLDALEGRLGLFAFVDHGAVYSMSPGHTAATSVGVGSVWTIRPEVAIETSVAFPLSDIVPGQDDFQLYSRLLLRPQF